MLLFLTFRAQKMHDSSMQACPYNSLKLRLNMSKCHNTWNNQPFGKYTTYKYLYTFISINFCFIELIANRIYSYRYAQLARYRYIETITVHKL